MSASHPRWFRRLGARVLLAVFAAAFVLDVLFFGLWEYLYFVLTPEWSEPGFVRGYADWLASLPEAERAEAAAKVVFFELTDRIVLGAVSALYGLAVAAAIAGFVWWTVVRRIQALSGQAAAPIDPERGLPPFHARGQDEIAVLAAEMNGLRARVGELLARLAEQERARREWVREVAHDLRTPLTALGVALERAQAPREPGKLAELVAAAREDVRRVQDLADDLLEIARLDAGDELVREPVPPGELLRAVVRTLSPVAEARGLVLTLDFQAHLPELVADGRRLARALENLLLNSLQHARARVRVAGASRADVLEIRIEDDGEGFPPGGGPARRRPDSAGVGLEVAHKVVAAHGGELELRNEAGGACAFVRLPLGTPARAARAASTSTAM